MYDAHMRRGFFQRPRVRGVRPGRAAPLLGLALATACADAGPEIALVIEMPASTQVTVGDYLPLSVTASSSVPAFTWSTSDERVAVVSQGTVEARRPGGVTISVSAPGAVPADIGLTVVERPGGYGVDEIDYFTEVAFGSEFGGATPLLRRWHADRGPLIRVNGAPSAGDQLALDSVIAELNRLTPLGIDIVADSPTVEMHFIPQSEFQDVLPQAPEGNNGIVWVWWGGDQHIFRSVVLISTTTAEARRAHIIREEITQMLGLLKDSFRYPASIFYQPVSDVTEYLPIDRSVIELLHRPELSVGMTAEEGAQVARTLLRPGPHLAAAAAVGLRARDPDAAGEARVAGSAGGSSGRR